MMAEDKLGWMCRSTKTNAFSIWWPKLLHSIMVLGDEMDWSRAVRFLTSVDLPIGVHEVWDQKDRLIVNERGQSKGVRFMTGRVAVGM